MRDPIHPNKTLRRAGGRTLVVVMSEIVRSRTPRPDAP